MAKPEIFEVVDISELADGGSASTADLLGLVLHC